MLNTESTNMRITTRSVRPAVGSYLHQGRSRVLAGVLAALVCAAGCVGTGHSSVRVTPSSAAESSVGIEGLDLTHLKVSQQLPDRIDKRSALDVVTVAAYLGTVSPEQAAGQYAKLVEDHGRAYETAFARDAFQSALACAWDAGDPSLIKRVLTAYDGRLDVIERAPEPKWIGELRGFFRVKDDMALRRAFERLVVEKKQTADPLLRRRAARWLDRHRTAVVRLVTEYRDCDPQNWQDAVLTDLIEAEANLLGTYANRSSEILLGAQARQLLGDTEHATSGSYVVAVAKLFLVKTGIVHQPDRTEFMLGNSYASRH
jgi:hypothetical protein